MVMVAAHLCCTHAFRAVLQEHPEVVEATQRRLCLTLDTGGKG